MTTFSNANIGLHLMENEAEELKQLPANEDKAYQGKGKEFGIKREGGNGDAREAGARGTGSRGAGSRGTDARGGARRISGTRRREDGLFEPLLLPIKHISVDNMCYPTLCKELLVKNHTLFTPRADDVIVTTYPRSGTTWTLEITRQIHLAQLTPLPAQHPLNTQDHMISAPWINNYNNMVHRNLDSDPSPRVMKSHNHYCHVNLLPSNTYTKLIHVMRDPKDVLCSAYHHTLQVGALLDYQGTYAEFVQFFLAGKVESGSYWDFNRHYLNNVNQHNILYLTYEELSSDKLGCIGQINSFLGYSTLSPEQMDKIDKMTRFEVMKRTQRPLQGNVQGTTGQSKGMLSERERQDVNVKTWIEFQDVADQIPTSYYQNIVN